MILKHIIAHLTGQQLALDSVSVNKVTGDLVAHNWGNGEQSGESYAVHHPRCVVSNRKKNSSKATLSFLTAWLVSPLRNASQRSNHSVEMANNLPHGDFISRTTEQKTTLATRNAFNYANALEIKKDLLQESPWNVIVFRQFANGNRCHPNTISQSAKRSKRVVRLTREFHRDLRVQVNAEREDRVSASKDVSSDCCFSKFTPLFSLQYPTITKQRTTKVSYA
jgi:hypothetical protein